MESTGIFPTENDVTLINRKVQALKEYDETIVRNLQIFLPLQMDTLVELRNRRRSMFDVANQSVCILPSLKVFAHPAFAERQASRRQGTGLAKVCHKRQILDVAGHSYVPQSIDRKHEELKMKVSAVTCIRSYSVPFYSSIVLSELAVHSRAHKRGQYSIQTGRYL